MLHDVTVEVWHRLRGIQQDGSRLSSSLSTLDICLLPSKCSTDISSASMLSHFTLMPIIWAKLSQVCYTHMQN